MLRTCLKVALKMLESLQDVEAWEKTEKIEAHCRKKCRNCEVLCSLISSRETSLWG